MAFTNKDNKYGGSSDVWNIAEGYTKLLILQPLVLADKMIRISKYGAETIEESMILSNYEKTKLRIEAIKRLNDEILLTIDNSFFVINDKNKKFILTKINPKLELVSNLLNKCIQNCVNSENGQEYFKINEKDFELALKYLRKVKSDIIKPLNDSNLIFSSSDETDIEAIKREISEGG